MIGVVVLGFLVGIASHSWGFGFLAAGVYVAGRLSLGWLRLRSLRRAVERRES